MKYYRRTNIVLLLILFVIIAIMQFGGQKEGVLRSGSQPVVVGGAGLYGKATQAVAGGSYGINFFCGKNNGHPMLVNGLVGCGGSWKA